MPNKSNFGSYYFTGEATERTFLMRNEIMTHLEVMLSPDGCWRATTRYRSNGSISIFSKPVDSGVVMIIWAQGAQKQVDNFAILQDDGNFCVYEGTNLKNKGELLWQSGTKDGKCVVLRPDGNLCVLNHDNPKNYNTGVVWQSGFVTGTADHYEVSGIEYLYDDMTFDPPAYINGFTQILNNNTDLEQTTTVSFSLTKSKSASYKTTTSTELGVKAGVEIKVPLAAKINMEASAKFGAETSKGEEVTTSETTQYSVPVKVGPRSSVKVDAVITKKVVRLPYRMIGGFVLKQKGQWFGDTAYCELKGEFKGENASEINVSYQQVSAPPQKIMRKALEVNIDGHMHKIQSANSGFVALGEPVDISKNVVKIG